MSNCIIVEGPDGSGKSTLLKRLEEVHNVKAMHAGGPPKTEEELRQRLELNPSAQLMDRWSAISEQVYGTVLRDKPLVSMDEMMWYVLEHKPHIIYCRPPNHMLEKNLDSLDKYKSYKSKEHCASVRRDYWRIVSVYDQLMFRLLQMGLIVTIYDYTGDRMI